MQSYHEGSEYHDFEDPEVQLSEIQNNIQHVERKMRLSDLEKKYDVENNSSEIKKNELEIKQLRLEMKELEVRMKISRKADENIIQKEFRNHSRELGQLKGKPAKESISILDSQILELDKKCKAFGHELQLLKKDYLNSEQQLKKMASECEEDFEHTEYDSLERSRELERDQEKLNKNIIECELVQCKYKRIKERLQKNQSELPRLVLEVQQECQKLVASDQNASEDVKLISETGGGDDIVFKERYIKRAVSPQKESSVSEISGHKEEVNKVKNILEEIRDVTCAPHIKDCERKILAQKSIHEDLFDLKKRLAKSLQELKTQKNQLDNRIELIKKQNLDESNSELNSDLSISKRRYAEQEIRKQAAKIEIDKLNSLFNEIEKGQAKILEVLEKPCPEAKCDLKKFDSH